MHACCCSPLRAPYRRAQLALAVCFYLGVQDALQLDVTAIYDSRLRLQCIELRRPAALWLGLCFIAVED
jgi:hypothetical protein